MGCPSCGPRLTARDAGGESVAGDAIELTVDCLAAGGVVAVETPCGLRLVADAARDDAVTSLRARKARRGKPLAVMVRDLATARQLVELSADEEALLECNERPIVLATRRAEPAASISPEVAPSRRRLGILLPVTPLDVVLLDAFERRTRRGVLAVTSGNQAGDPVLVDSTPADAERRVVADLALCHDQSVLRAADDSVVRLDPGGPTFFRRARGYAPLPISLGVESPPVVATGGDRDSALAVTRGDAAFLSPHLGNLQRPAARERWRQTAADLCTLLGVEPRAVVVDAQADPRAARLGSELTGEVIEVQHHHAQVAACLAEHGHDGPAIGLVLDGGGRGPDGTVWGGEVLVCDRSGFTRAGHMEPVVLAAAAEEGAEPWAMAVSHLFAAYGDVFRRLPLELFTEIDAADIEAAVACIKGEGRVTVTTSAGLLLDAVSALLGLCFVNRHECDAAMALESVMGDLGGPGDETYGVRIVPRDDALVLCTEPLIRGVVVDLIRGLGAGMISLRFHRSLAALLAAACECVWKRTGTYTVALAGGVLLDRYLTAEVTRRLKRLGFSVLRPQVIPPGDGGLAFGQAAVAAARLGTAG
jgi:hydrogenase maturation protein HypF